MEHYQTKIADLAQEYPNQSFEQGLSDQQAQQRLAQNGPNKLETKTTPKWILFVHQFNNMITYILLLAMILTLTMGHHTDAIVIALVVIINAIIGYYQEANAADALSKIQQMLATKATVYRQDRRLDIPATDLVVGDVVYLEAGDSVPADLRLVTTANLRIQESALTGESDAVTKTTAELLADKVPLAEQTNMAFTSTAVANGSGLGVVVAVGKDTQIGQISTAIAETKPKLTPLMREINGLGKGVSIAVLIAAACLFVLGLIFDTYSVSVLALAVVTMIVGSVPEGLPATTSVILALGVSDMAKNKKTIIKSLPAVETLGAVDVIATDKTGTLTKNEMTMTDIYTKKDHLTLSGTGYEPQGDLLADGHKTTANQTVQTLLLSGYIANDTELVQENGQFDINGEPTDGAFLTAYHKVFATMSEPEYETIDMLPFDSDYRYIARLVKLPNQTKPQLFIKGSPDKLFTMAKNDPTFDEKYWQQKVAELSSCGKRVVAVGQKTLTSHETTISHDLLNTGIDFLGIVGIIDPPRTEVIETLKTMNQAHVEVKMITGDSPLTASAIGKQLGLAPDIKAITGAQWDTLTPEQKRKAAVENQIFARTTPKNKLEIVKALQQSGKVTAMTGDGVNDAPALKAADIGVAMGIKGTDVARDAADMVLTDDNFATLGQAIKEGRRIYDNIKKSILFLLPTSFAEGLIIFFSIMFNQPMPLQATQMLWINMVSAITIQFAFIFEPAEAGIMQRRPRKTNQAMMNRHDVIQMAYVSVLMAVSALFSYEWLQSLGADAKTASTMMLNIIIISKIFYLFNIRTPKLAFSKEFFGNKKAFYVIFVMLLLQLILTYVPFMQEVFYTEPLTLNEWLAAILCGMFVLVITEIDKFIRLKKQA